MKLNTYVVCTLITATALLAGCGQDPPEAAKSVGGNEAAPAAMPAGVQLVAVDGSIEQAINGSAKCNLESIAGKNLETTGVEVPISNNVQVEGWYVDVAKGDVGDPVSVVIETSDLSKRWSAQVPARSERGDVDASLNGNGKFTQSGISVALDFTGLPAGDYGIYLNGSAGPCSVGRVFTAK